MAKAGRIKEEMGKEKTTIEKIAGVLNIELSRPFRIKKNGHQLPSVYEFKHGTFMNVLSGGVAKNVLTHLIWGKCTFDSYVDKEILRKEEKKRFLPKEGETYWRIIVGTSGSLTVSQCTYFEPKPTDIFSDIQRAWAGLCFRTRAEAREALKEIKQFYADNYEDKGEKENEDS